MRNAADILWLGFRRRLTVVAGTAIILAALLSLVYTVVIYASGLRPIIEGQVLALAEVAAGTIEYALESGVPWDRLNGVDSYLSTIVAQNGELASLRLETGLIAEASATTAQSTGMIASVIDLGVLFSLLFGNSLDPIRVPVSLDGQVLGQLVAVTDTGVIVERLQNVFFDTLVILFVSILVANEVVIVFVSNKVQQPLERLSGALFKRASGDLGTYGATLGLGGRISALIGQLNVLNASLWDRARRALEQGSRTLTSTIQISNLADRQGVRRASVLDARIPLFIFCFAEELQKSFLPLFVADMWQPTDWFDRSLMLGMPISLFMFVIAALTPFSGALVERFGTRRMFLYGLVPAVGGYLLCAFASSANDILLGRGLTAVGYAIITIASQSYIADVATRDNRAKSMAVFVGVLMTATLCGTAVGAVLAEWVGFKVVFLISTVLAAAAGVLALITLFPKEAMLDDEEAPVGAKAKGSLGSFFRILLNARFALLVIFCAIPAKVVLTGILYLLVPLYLAELASSQSEIGRIMMLYSLIIIPISPLASRLADRFDRNLAFVVGATLASGLLLVALVGNSSVLGVLVMVAGLGLVHAFLKAPLIVSVVEVADADSRISRTAAMSLLRTSERIGSVVGPVLVGGLLTVLTFPQTIATIGAIVLGFGVLMVVILLLKQLMSRPQVSA